MLLGEPDRLSRGFALGPRVLASLQMVRDGGFLAPGMPFGETARIALKPGVSLAAAQRGDRQRAAGPAAGGSATATTPRPASRG